MTLINDVLPKIGRDFDPSRTLLIGDSKVDTEAGFNVGINTVMLAAGSSGLKFRLKDPLPTFVITEPSELLSIVEGTKCPESTREVQIQPSLWKSESWSGGLER